MEPSTRFFIIISFVMLLVVIQIIQKQKSDLDKHYKGKFLDWEDRFVEEQTQFKSFKQNMYSDSKPKRSKGSIKRFFSADDEEL
jgi:hypothetical protein